MDNALPNSPNKLRQGNDRTKATTVKYKHLQSTSYESSSLQALKQSFNDGYGLRRNVRNSAFCLRSATVYFCLRSATVYFSRF
jgi:hypothetical protein